MNILAFLHELKAGGKEGEFLNKYGFVAREHEVINRTVELHWHDYYELEIVTKGNGEHILNNRKYPLRRGNTILLSPADLHSVTGFSDFTVLNIVFRDDLLPQKLNDFILSNGTLECEFSENELSYILGRIDAIGNINPDFLFEKELIKNIISEVILRVFEKSAINQDTKTSPLVQSTVSFMMKHFKEDITIFSVSKEFAVTPKYLGAVFKKNIGISFHDYLNNLRLKFACDLLRNTNSSVKETAFDSGFNSVEHFVYVFKKYLKITPGKFRGQYLL